MKKIPIYLLFILFNTVHGQIFKTVESYNIPQEDTYVKILKNADIDNDGDKDLITYSGGNQADIYWYRNYDGNGSYNVAQKLNVNGSNFELFDYDIDNDLDIIYSTNHYDKSILSWIENSNGEGQFTNKSIFDTIPGEVRNIIGMDINSDSHNDFLISTSTSIVLYLGKGTSTDYEKIIIDDEIYNIRDVIINDIDNDDDLDILISLSDLSDVYGPSQRAWEGVYWYENILSDNLFGDVQNIIDSVYGVFTICAGDIGLNRNRLLIGDQFGRNIIQVKYHNGSFVIEDTIRNDVSGIQNLELTDLNMDGLNDLVYSVYDRVVWLENKENYFDSPSIIGNKDTRSRYEVGFNVLDVNNNTYSDVVTALNNLTVFKNDEGKFNYKSIIFANKYVSHFTIGLLDNDTDYDIVSSNSSTYLSDNWYRDFILNNFNRDAKAHFENEILTSNVDESRSVIVGDINGDNKDDIVVGDNSNISWFKNIDNLGNFDIPRLICSDAHEVYDLMLTDMDQDGDNDILAAEFDDDEITWYENVDGSGIFGTSHKLTDVAYGAYSICRADLNSDGLLDVIGTSVNNQTVFWFENLGEGKYSDLIKIKGRNFASQFINDHLKIYPADLDFDGDIDLYVSSTKGASSWFSPISWLENVDGNGNFIYHERLVDYEAQNSLIADVDLDGDMDIIASKRYVDSIVWFENVNGLGDYSLSHKINTSTHFKSPAMVDLDSDGDLDLTYIDFDGIHWIENLLNSKTYPKLRSGIPDTTVYYNETFNYTIPQYTFYDTTSLQLSYSANLVSGESLPDWLLFNSITLTFSGIPTLKNQHLDIVVKATNQSGSTISDTFDLHSVYNINPILIEIEKTNTTCSNTNDGEIIVHASGGLGELKYSIDSINFAIDSVFSNLKDSTYKVFVIGEEPDYIVSESIEITYLNLAPDKPIITKTPNTDNTYTLYSSYGSTYQWYKDDLKLTDETNRTYFAEGSGKYQVEVFNSNGCSNISDSVFILINNSPPTVNNDEYSIDLYVEDTAWISMDTMFIDENIPQGDSLIYALVNLSDDAVHSFITWDNDSLMRIIPSSSEASPYSFWIKATDLAGEKDSLKIVLNVMLPNHTPIALRESLTVSVEALQTLEISMDTLFNDDDIQNGDQLDYSLLDIENTGIADFSTWQTNGVLEINPTTDQIGSHNFWIIATDQSAEKDSTEVNLTVTDVTSGIFTMDSENIVIYPNPSNGQLYISINGATTKENTTICIHNMVGKVVFESNYKPHIDLNGLENGVYLLKLSLPQGDLVRKLVLQR